MKVVGVVDCVKKNLTSFIVELSKELTGRGYKVALVKCITNAQGSIDKGGNEPEPYAQTVVSCFPAETIFSFKDKRPLENILAFIDADYVLVKGFKENKSYPRIILMYENNKGSYDDEGIEIAGYGKAKNTHFPVAQDIKQLVDIIEEKSFKLPKLDCAACGFDSCYAFAQEIIKGNKKLEDCVSLNPKVTVTIDGSPLPMNPFISRIVENTIRALLSSFKGYKKGRIEISIS